MIREDRLWKATLGAYISNLEEAIKRPFLNSEEVEFEVEHLLFVIAASARKLLESHVVPDQLGQEEISVDKFSPTGHPITFQSRNSLSRCYQMQTPERSSLKVKRILDHIMHGYVSHVGFDIRGEIVPFTNRVFLIVSDWDKNKFLLCVSFETFLAAFTKFSDSPYYSPIRYQLDQAIAKRKKDGNVSDNPAADRV